jgi:hypothetical protein
MAYLRRAQRVDRYDEAIAACNEAIKREPTG